MISKEIHFHGCTTFTATAHSHSHIHWVWLRALGHTSQVATFYFERKDQAERFAAAINTSSYEPPSIDEPEVQNLLPHEEAP